VVVGLIGISVAVAATVGRGVKVHVAGSEWVAAGAGVVLSTLQPVRLRARRAERSPNGNIRQRWVEREVARSFRQLNLVGVKPPLSG